MVFCKQSQLWSYFGTYIFTTSIGNCIKFSCALLHYWIIKLKLFYKKIQERFFETCQFHIFKCIFTSSCPFDWVRVYDGPDNSSAVIGTYCGQQRNLVLYSSDERLLVTFYTLPRAASTQNRGFKGIFEFSESFVKLGKYIIDFYTITNRPSQRCFFIV